MHHSGQSVNQLRYKKAPLPVLSLIKKILAILLCKQYNSSMPKEPTFRKKRGDTKMETIEKKYGRDFGVRSDKQLQNYLDEIGYSSLSELLRKKRK